MTVCPHPVDLVPTFNWVFGYQPVVSVILSQPSRYKKEESNLLADEKGSQHWIQVFVWVIYLYLIHLCFLLQSYVLRFYAYIIMSNRLQKLHIVISNQFCHITFDVKCHLIILINIIKLNYREVFTVGKIVFYSITISLYAKYAY